VRLILGHGRDSDVVAGVCLIRLHHLAYAGFRCEVQHVGQQQRERLVADNVAGAPHGMAETERGLLAREAGLARGRKIAHERFQLRRLAAFRQGTLQFVLAVEVILDHTLVAASDEDEVLDPRRTRFVHDMLEDGAVDDRQHLLGYRLGRGQKSGAEAGHRKHGLANTLGHREMNSCRRPVGGQHTYPPTGAGRKCGPAVKRSWKRNRHVGGTESKTAKKWAQNGLM
jgi:hypothetical protein